MMDITILFVRNIRDRRDEKRGGGSQANEQTSKPYSNDPKAKGLLTH